MSSLGARLKTKQGKGVPSDDNAEAVPPSVERSPSVADLQAAASAAASAWKDMSGFTRQQVHQGIQDVEHGIGSAVNSLSNSSNTRRGVDWATLKTAASDADDAQTRRLFATLASPTGKSTPPRKPTVSRTLAPFQDFQLGSSSSLPSVAEGAGSAFNASSRHGGRPNTTQSAVKSSSSATVPNNSFVPPLRQGGQRIGLTRAAVSDSAPSLLLQEMGAGTSDGLFSPPIPRQRANGNERSLLRTAQSATRQRSVSPPLPSRTVEEAVTAALPGQASRQRSVKGSHVFGRAVVSSDVQALVTKAVSILGASSALARVHVTGAPQVLQLPGGEFTARASPSGAVLSSMAHLDRDFSTLVQDVEAVTADAVGSPQAAKQISAAAPMALKQWAGARFRSKWAHCVAEDLAAQVALSSAQQGSVLRQVAATTGEVVLEMQQAVCSALQALHTALRDTATARDDAAHAQKSAQRAHSNAATVALRNISGLQDSSSSQHGDVHPGSPGGAASSQPSRLAPLARDSSRHSSAHQGSSRAMGGADSHKSAMKTQLEVLGSEVGALRSQLASIRAERQSLQQKLEQSLPKEREHELLTQLRSALSENTRLKAQAAQQRELLDELLAKEARQREALHTHNAIKARQGGANDPPSPRQDAELLPAPTTSLRSDASSNEGTARLDDRDTTVGSSPAVLPVVGSPELDAGRLLNPLAPTVGGGELEAGSPAVQNALMLLPRSHGGDSSSLPVHRLALTRGSYSRLRGQLALPSEDVVDAAVHTHKVAALAAQKRTHEVPCLVFRSLLPGLFGRPRPPLRMSATWVRWVSRSLLLAKTAADAQAEMGGAQRQRFPEFVWAWFDSGAARASALAAGLMLPPSVLLGGGADDGSGPATRGTSTASAVSLKAARSLAANSSMVQGAEGTHSVASLAAQAWRRGVTGAARGGNMGPLGGQMRGLTAGRASVQHTVSGRDSLAQVAHLAGSPAGGGDAVALPASLSHPTDVAQRAEVIALSGAQPDKASSRRRHRHRDKKAAGARNPSNAPPGGKRRPARVSDASSGSDTSDTESVVSAGTNESAGTGSTAADSTLAFHDVWSLLAVLRTQDGLPVTDDDLRWAWYYGVREISARVHFETQARGFYAGQSGGYAALSKAASRPLAASAGSGTSPGEGTPTSESKVYTDHDLGFDVAEPAEQGSIEASLMYNWLDERHGSDELAFSQHALDVLVGVLPMGRLGWGPDASSSASVGTTPLVLWLAAVAEGGYSGVGSSASEERSVVDNALRAAEQPEQGRSDNVVGFAVGNSSQSSGGGGAARGKRANRPPPASAMHTVATPQARALAAQGGSMQRTAQFLGAAQLLGGRGPGGTRVKLSSSEQAAAASSVPVRVAASFLASSTATAAALVPVNVWIWAQHAVDATRRLFVRLPSAERRRIVRNALTLCVPATGARLAFLRRNMGGEEAAAAGRYGPTAGIGAQGDTPETHSPLRAAADEARRTGGRAKRAHAAAPLPCLDLFALLQLWCVEFRQEQAHRSAMLRVLYDTAVMHTVAATSALAAKATRKGNSADTAQSTDLQQVSRLTSLPPDGSGLAARHHPPATPLKDGDSKTEVVPVPISLRDSRLWRARSDLLPVGQIAAVGDRNAAQVGRSDPRSTDLGDRSATALVQLTVDVQQVGVMLRSIAPWLLPAEVAAVYREALQMGAGSVTLPALMAACEARQVFTRSLLLSPYTHRGLLSLSEELPPSPALLLSEVVAERNHGEADHSHASGGSPGGQAAAVHSQAKTGLKVDVGIAMARGGGGSQSGGGLEAVSDSRSPTRAVRQTSASAAGERTAAAAQAVLLASASASLAHALNSRYRMLTDDIGGWLSTLPLPAQLRAGSMQARVRAELRAALDPLASTVVGTATPESWWALLGDLGDTSVLSISSLSQEARATLKRLQGAPQGNDAVSGTLGIAGRGRAGTFASLGGSSASAEDSREEGQEEGGSTPLPTTAPATAGIGVNEDDIEMLRVRDGLRVLPAYRRYLLTLLHIRAEAREGVGEVALGAMAKHVGKAVAQGGAWGASDVTPLAIVRAAAAWVGSVERECEALESMLREESSGPTAALLRQSGTRLALASTAVVAHGATSSAVTRTAAWAGAETPIGAASSPLKNCRGTLTDPTHHAGASHVLNVFDELLASENGSFTSAQMKRNRTLRKLHSLCLATPVGSPLWLASGAPLWLMSAMAWLVDSLVQGGDDDAPAVVSLAKGVKGGSFATKSSLSHSLQASSTVDPQTQRCRLRPVLVEAPSPAQEGSGEAKSSRKRRHSKSKRRSRRGSTGGEKAGSASAERSPRAGEAVQISAPPSTVGGTATVDLTHLLARGSLHLSELRSQLAATQLSPAAVLGDPSFVAALLQVLLGVTSAAGASTPLGARLLGASLSMPLEAGWGGVPSGTVAASSSIVQLHRATTASERIAAVMQGVSVVRIQRAVRQHLLFPSGVPPLRRKQAGLNRSNLFGGVRRVVRSAGSAFVPPPGLALVGAAGGGDSSLATSGAIPSGAVVSLPASSGERGAPDAAAHTQAQAALGRTWQLLAGCVGAPSYAQTVDTGHGPIAPPGLPRDVYRILYMAVRKVAQCSPAQRSTPLAYIAALARASDAAGQVADKLQQYSHSIVLAGAAASQLLFDGDIAGGGSSSHGGGAPGGGGGTSIRGARISSLQLTAASTSPQFPLLSSVEMLNVLAGVLDSWARLTKRELSTASGASAASGVSASASNHPSLGADPPSTLASLLAAARRSRVTFKWSPESNMAEPGDAPGDSALGDMFSASALPTLQRLRQAANASADGLVAEATQCMGSSLPEFVRWWLHHAAGAAQWAHHSATGAAHGEVVDALEHALYRSVRHWAPHHLRARVFAVLCGIPVVAAPRPDGGFSCAGGSPADLRLLRKAVGGNIPRHDEFGATRGAAGPVDRSPSSHGDDPLLGDLAMQGVWEGVLNSSSGAAAASLGGLGWAHAAAGGATPLGLAAGGGVPRRPGDMWDAWRRSWCSTFYGSALSVGAFVRLPSDFHPALRGGAALTAALPHALVASGVRAFVPLRQLDDAHKDVVTRARLMGATHESTSKASGATDAKAASKEDSKMSSITLDALPGVAQAAVGQGFASWSCQAGAWWMAPTGATRPSAVPHRPLAARSLDTAQSRLAAAGGDAEGPASPAQRQGKRQEPWYQGGIGADGNALPVLTPQDREWELQREMACDDGLVFYGQLLLLLHAHGAAVSRAAVGAGISWSGVAAPSSTGGAATPGFSLRASGRHDDSTDDVPRSPSSVGGASEASFDAREEGPVGVSGGGTPRAKVHAAQFDVAHTMFPLPVCWGGATPPSSIDKGPHPIATATHEPLQISSLGSNAALNGGADTSNGREGAPGAYFPSPAEIEAGQYACTGALGQVPLGAAQAVVASLMAPLLGSAHGKGEGIARQLQEALQGIAFAGETAAASEGKLGNPLAPPLSSADPSEADAAAVGRMFTDAQGSITWVSVDDVAWVVMRAWAQDKLETQYAMGAGWVQAHVLSPLAGHITHALSVLQKIAEVQRDHEAVFEEERSIRRRAATAYMSPGAGQRPSSRGSTGSRPISRGSEAGTPPSGSLHPSGTPAELDGQSEMDLFLSPTATEATAGPNSLTVPKPLVPHPLQLLSLVDDALTGVLETASMETPVPGAVHPHVWASLLPPAHKWSRVRGATNSERQHVPGMAADIGPVLEQAVQRTTHGLFQSGVNGRLSAAWRCVVDARVAMFGSVSYSPLAAAVHTASAVQGCGTPNGWVQLLTTSMSAAVAHVSALVKQAEDAQIRLNTGYMDLMALGDPQVVSHYRATGSAQVRRLGALQSALALRLTHALWSVAGVTLNQGGFINQSRQHGAAFLSPGELAGQALQDARTAAAVGKTASSGGARRASRVQDFLRRGDNLAAAAARQLSTPSASAGMGSQAAAAAITGFAPLHHPSSCSVSPMHPRLVGMLNETKGNAGTGNNSAGVLACPPAVSACLPSVLAAARTSGLIGVTWDAVKCSTQLTPASVASNAVAVAAAGCPLMVPTSSTAPVLLHLHGTAAAAPSAREHNALHKPMVPDRIRTKTQQKARQPSTQTGTQHSPGTGMVLPAALRASVQAATKAPSTPAARTERHASPSQSRVAHGSTPGTGNPGVPRTPAQPATRQHRSPSVASRLGGAPSPESLNGTSGGPASHRRSRSQPQDHQIREPTGPGAGDVPPPCESLKIVTSLPTGSTPRRVGGGGAAGGNSTMGALAREVLRALHRSCTVQAGKAPASGALPTSQGLLLGRVSSGATRMPSHGSAMDDAYTQWHSSDGMPCALTHAEFLAQRYVVEAVAAVVLPVANMASGVLLSAVDQVPGVPASLKQALQMVYALWRGARSVKGGFDLEERAMIRGWVTSAQGTTAASTSAASRARRAQRSSELLSSLNKRLVALQQKVLKGGSTGTTAFENSNPPVGPHVPLSSSLLLAQRDVLGHMAHLLQHAASGLPNAAFVGRAAETLMRSALSGTKGGGTSAARRRASSVASVSDASSAEGDGELSARGVEAPRVAPHTPEQEGLNVEQVPTRGK